MSETNNNLKFVGDIKFPTNFDVQITRPLDNRLVVDSVDDLLTIAYPYLGMVVSIAGTSDLYVLVGSDARVPENWKLASGDTEALKDISEVIGNPSSESEEGSGLFKDIEDIRRDVKKTNFSIPVMSQSMVDEIDADSDIDFDSSDDPYIFFDDGASLEGEAEENSVITAKNGTYLYIMMQTIRALQEEVARLKNSFEFGIDSYKNETTAKSRVIEEYSDVAAREPLWGIDPGYLSLVPDSQSFNTFLDKGHSFKKLGETGEIKVDVEGQLGFDNCIGRFYDGDGEGNDLTLYNMKDSKLITYLVTDKPNIKMTLWSLDDKSKAEKTIDLSNVYTGGTVEKYGYCIVISRKVNLSKSSEYKGKNYIYVSLINYDNDKKLAEGYLNNFGTLQETPFYLDDRYSIHYIDFDRLNLYRMKFYTKFEDFSDEVITSAPNEDDYKFGAAHITIRSVEDSDMLERVKSQLREDELIWNRKNKTLHIKSNGEIYLIGSNNTGNNTDKNMTNRELIAALQSMGIIVNVKYKTDSNGNPTDEIESLDELSLNQIGDITFVNEDTGKKFTFSVNAEGKLVGKDKSAKTIEEQLGVLNDLDTEVDNIRGFSSEYLQRISGSDSTSIPNSLNDMGLNSDRLRISSFYAPLETDDVHGCSHSFIELENSSDKDIPLTGMYLHFFNGGENYDDVTKVYKGGVHHLALDGVIPAGGTYLIRGARHAQDGDKSVFIKVDSYDQEWYENKELLSFEQKVVKTVPSGTSVTEADDNKVKLPYRFCLTYGLPELKSDDTLVVKRLNDVTYKKADCPNQIVNRRFIDSCNFSSFGTIAGQGNGWCATGVGITIKPNSMFRLMFALDPAKQAFNGFTKNDSSRVRYASANDLQVVELNKEFIGFPFSDDIALISRYTPKASYEHRNVMTDKTQLDMEKPNMVSCFFGIDVYKTRCFNWISAGVFDEYLWVRKKGESEWSAFSSYKKVDEDVSEGSEPIHRKEFSALVNNTVYARIINRFPGNNVLFTAHKCIIDLPNAESDPVVYEYVVGRPDKDGNPDSNHTSDIQTFTLYPIDWEGRVYQITDQQGFHWIEYQVWAASAKFLNETIKKECDEINSKESGASESDSDFVTKVFPILINTGDMTQSGARINEWLDYYNGGKCLFNHLEQMNCVGNNDLCDVDINKLGTGNDTGKSNAHFFHYFNCYDLKDTSKTDETYKKFYDGTSLIVKAHGEAHGETPDRYIPSFYKFETNGVMYIMCNSEITKTTCDKWYNLHSSDYVVNIYTGIEVKSNGEYIKSDTFTPLYETMYRWLKDNKDNKNKKVIVAMHEMPFTVITQSSLTNKDAKFIVSTRNHPNGKDARVGSNMNQLDRAENRGIYWCSRLLESFNCKLVIGGHKHTYALTYPIKEMYQWTTIEDSATVNWSYNNPKPMSENLSDEAGENPDYNIKWEVDDNSEYKVSTDVTVKLNSTKTPYIPKSLYDEYTQGIEFTGLFRCCTPIEITDNPNYDGFVTYSMCQATGYKLKSNKELPSASQVFSKLIPKTKHNPDKPNGDQLYPMYSVISFNDDCSEADILMVRITGVFNSNGLDTFNQVDYGKKGLSKQYLCTSTTMYGAWNNSYTSEDIYLHIIF